MSLIHWFISNFLHHNVLLFSFSQNISQVYFSFLLCPKNYSEYAVSLPCLWIFYISFCVDLQFQFTVVGENALCNFECVVILFVSEQIAVLENIPRVTSKNASSAPFIMACSQNVYGVCKGTELPLQNLQNYTYHQLSRSQSQPQNLPWILAGINALVLVDLLNVPVFVWSVLRISRLPSTLWLSAPCPQPERKHARTQPERKHARSWSLDP